jgi:hypothetical protein
MSGQLHASATLLPGTHWIGGWVGHRAGLDFLEKKSLDYFVIRAPERPARTRATTPTAVTRVTNQRTRRQFWICAGNVTSL